MCDHLVNPNKLHLLELPSRARSVEGAERQQEGKLPFVLKEEDLVVDKRLAGINRTYASEEPAKRTFLDRVADYIVRHIAGFFGYDVD